MSNVNTLTIGPFVQQIAFRTALAENLAFITQLLNSQIQVLNTRIMYLQTNVCDKQKLITENYM